MILKLNSSSILNSLASLEASTASSRGIWDYLSRMAFDWAAAEASVFIFSPKVTGSYLAASFTATFLADFGASTFLAVFFSCTAAFATAFGFSEAAF